MTSPYSRDAFIYLRTHLAIEFAEEALRALAQVFPHSEPSDGYQTSYFVPVLGFGGSGSGVTFENGLVIRGAPSYVPTDCVNILKPALAKFEAWAIHDRWGNFIEHPTGGLMGRYFERLNQTKPIPTCQIFVMGQENARRYKQALDQIRARFKELCLPVFHFRDGQIMFLHSREPASVIARRCGQSLRGLDNWAIVDSDGATYSASGEDEDCIWRDTELNGLRFGSGEPND